MPPLDDLIGLTDGPYWMMCAVVTGTVVQHIGADQQLLFEWTAFDHFSIEDLEPAERGGREEIARALAQLRPLHREAFLLRHVENLDYAEMALRSGTGESTLRMRVKRANDRLRELLRDVRVG
jgi:DNA-directed RNA polymerase specialized sigma24 family protein